MEKCAWKIRCFVSASDWEDEEDAAEKQSKSRMKGRAATQSEVAYEMRVQLNDN